MHVIARAAIILSLTISFALLDVTIARAGSETVTGTVVALGINAEGTFFDERGDAQPILTSRLRNQSNSELSVIYTLYPRPPKSGANYELGTPSALRTVGLHTAYWLAQHHENIGTPLRGGLGWSEHQAVQLCIWHRGAKFELSPSRVLDQTVLARAQELCTAAEKADPESTEAFFSPYGRRLDLRLNVRRATATRVFLEAQLKDAEKNEGVPNARMTITYDGMKSPEQSTGKEGVLLVPYKRSDETMDFDALCKWQFKAGNPWVSSDGTQPPIVTGEPVPVDYRAHLEIKPQDLASKEDLAYQWVGQFFGVTGATVGMIIIIGGWLLNLPIWFFGRWSGARKAKRDVASGR